MRKRTQFLPYSPPCIGGEEIEEVVDTLKSQWITTGPKTKKFESDFQSYVGSDSALAINSCTAGLHLALKVLGVGPCDEVITTPLTFSATVNVIEHVGAKPVLVDILPDTLLIDPEKIKRAITSKTKVILPVHYAGQPADMSLINQIATENNLFVIEDAAHALPTRYVGGELVGSSKNLTSFSFYATKNMTTAEGGMLTGPEELIEEARMMSLHGMSRDAWKRFDKEGSWEYDLVAPGYKYNMTDIQSSLGLVQLKKLESFYQRRCEVVQLYLEAFGGNKLIKTLPSQWSEGSQTAWHLFVIQIDFDRLKIDRNDFMKELKKYQIGSSVHYTPIHMFSYYKEKYGFKMGDYPVAEKAYSQMLSLPLNPSLRDEDVADVIHAVNDILSINIK